MSRATLRVLAAAALVGIALEPSVAHADNASARELSLLTYEKPQPPHYFRVALEELAIFGAGLVQYQLDKTANSRDWQFNYDWPSFRARLEGGAYSFDNNGFDTNFLFHPFSGTLYYSSARANHLSPFEAFAVAFGTSFLWEFFGEFREKPSINDIVVTPVAGLAWGETTTQLGAFFLRGCPSTAHEVLGSTLAPFIALHDALDGAERVHTDCEEPASAHRFRFALTAGEAWSEGVAPYATISGSLQSEVMHLPGFARPGLGLTTFADGNVSRLVLDLGVARENVTDVRFVTQTVLAGIHYRNNVVHERHVDRHEALFGFLVGAEYSRHRYDPEASSDRIFLLDLPALTTRYYGRSRELGWELALDVGGSFGGADALALPRAQRRGSGALDLTSVAATQGYSHVAGISISPRLRLEVGAAEFGLELRSDRLLAFRVLDSGGMNPGALRTTPVSEFRRRGSLFVALGAPSPVRFLLNAHWINRAGSVGDVHVSKNELSLSTGIELAP